MPNLSVLHVNNCVNSFTCSIDSIYKTFVYKVLWIFTVKCLQLFNKELYVYFVQAFFVNLFIKKKINSRNQQQFVILKRLKNLHASLLQAVCKINPGLVFIPDLHGHKSRY